MDFKFYFCESIASRNSYEPYVHTNSEQWIKWIVNNLTPKLRDIFNVSVHLFRFLWSTISVAVVVHARGCAWTQKTRENEALIDHEVIRTNNCDSMLRMRSVMHQWKVYFYWLFAMRRNLHATFRLRSKVFRTWQTCGDVFFSRYSRHLNYEQSRHYSLIAKITSISIQVLQSSALQSLLLNAIDIFPMMTINRRIYFSLE